MERNVTSTNTSKKQELKTLEEKLMMKDEQLFNQLVDLLNSNHIQIDLLEEQPFVVCSKEKEVEVCHSLYSHSYRVLCSSMITTFTLLYIIRIILITFL